MTTKPQVLCLSGLDPVGGAGLQADIEAIGALGGHALPLMTANTVQDSDNVRRVVAVPPILLAEQIAVVAADCRIDAVKIGLLGDPLQLDPVVRLLQSLKVPVVVDPVLRAGGGTNLVGARLKQALLEQLLPHVTLLTPNVAEARQLTLADDLRTCAGRLLDLGVQHVLITGGDEPGADVTNYWEGTDGSAEYFRWARLHQRFHGAGCTLASACAALLARGLPMAEALMQAQRYTHESLAQAFAVGSGRLIPGRRRA